LLTIVEKPQKTLKDKMSFIKKWDGNSGLSEAFGAASSSHYK